MDNLDASPLVASARICERGPGRILTSFVVRPDEPVLAGHFPGYPILPGVCLVECAHRSAMLALADLAGPGQVHLVGVDSARFQNPVFPGDEVLTEVSIVPDTQGWLCRARLTVRRDAVGEPAQAAIVRLRYGTEDRSAGDS